MRNATARSLILLLLTGLAACSGGTSSRVTVGNLGNEEFLRLRAGPGLGYAVVLGVPEGTALIRQDCTTELGQLWCRVALAEARNVTGHVAADYLTAP